MTVRRVHVVGCAQLKNEIQQRHRCSKYYQRFNKLIIFVHSVRLRCSNCLNIYQFLSPDVSLLIIHVYTDVLQGRVRSKGAHIYRGRSSPLFIILLLLPKRRNHGRPIYFDILRPIRIEEEHQGRAPFRLRATIPWAYLQFRLIAMNE